MSPSHPQNGRSRFYGSADKRTGSLPPIGMKSGLSAHDPIADMGAAVHLSAVEVRLCCKKTI